MDEAQVDAYLERIGVERPGTADLGVLRELQRAHLRTVPFENLSIHLDERIVLDEKALFEKVVMRRRGGFCYELNGLFAALLRALGFRVSLLGARVFTGEVAGVPLAHATVRVDLEEPWLADVGFGRFTEEPLRLDFRGDQVDPEGVFRVSETGYGELDVTREGVGECRIEPRPYELSDFAPTCWWTQTSPDSHFVTSLTCSMVVEGGRTTLSGDRLILTRGGEREERLLEGDAAILAAYREHFGIVLDRVPRVRGTQV
jgi:N-hydroxyarylamine O-acetyltransferase